MQKILGWVALFSLLFAPHVLFADVGDLLFKINASDFGRNDRFGRSVGISGNIAISGAYFDDDNGHSSGSAYLFDATSGLELAKLTPSDGEAGDFFGASVDIDSNTAIVGADGSTNFGPDTGSAYLFDVSTGSQIAKLVPEDGAEGDRFGFSVGISGDLAVVGAWVDDDNGNGSGSAYVFDAVSGRQLHKLTPTDGEAFDFFGKSVGIHGNIAVVGAVGDRANGGGSGSAYLFDATTGAQLAKLLPEDGAADDFFGVSVDTNGTTAIVGAYHDKVNGISTGSAYLFDVSTGAQLAKLTPNDGAGGDEFGISVGISEDTVIVGSDRNTSRERRTAAAYLFDLSTRQQLAMLVPEQSQEFSHYASAVDIGSRMAIVGAEGTNLNVLSGYNSGAAYIYSTVPEPGTVWLMTLMSPLWCLGRGMRPVTCTKRHCGSQY